MKINDFDFTLGADPEMAVYNVTKGMYVSPYDILPGSKAEPYRVKDGAIQVDGFAAEFNIDPCETEEEFVEKAFFVKDQMLEIMQANSKDKLELHAYGTVTFDQKYFDSIPDSVKEVGCSPDYKKDGKEALSPVSDTDTTRYFGGHIHLGWTKVKDPHEIGHFLDCRFLNQYVHDRLFYHYYSTESHYYWQLPERLKAAPQPILRKAAYAQGDRAAVYGQRFRPKNYGVELRHFGNFWMLHKEYAKGMLIYLKSELLFTVNKQERVLAS